MKRRILCFLICGLIVLTACNNYPIVISGVGANGNIISIKGELSLRGEGYIKEFYHDLYEGRSSSIHIQFMDGSIISSSEVTIFVQNDKKTIFWDNWKVGYIHIKPNIYYYLYQVSHTQYWGNTFFLTPYSALE